MRRLATTFSLLAFLGTTMTASASSSRRPEVPAGIPAVMLTSPSSRAPASASRYTVFALEDHAVDVGAFEIPATPQPLPHEALPQGGAVGTSNAFMSLVPDMAPQSATDSWATTSSGWIPGEKVTLYFNGAMSVSFNADPNGIIAVYVYNAGLGTYTMAEVGNTSGKVTGGAVQVVASLPEAPVLAVAPHAVASDGTGTIYLYGHHYPPSTSLTIRRDGVSIGNVTSSAAGRFFVGVTLPAGPDGSSVYSVDAGMPGTLAGTSVEERADAGTPPNGDMNPSRLLVDSAVLSTGSFIWTAMVGEGFQPGENVALSGCSSTMGTANAGGAIGIFLGTPGTPASYACVLTGMTSGRVARASFLVDANVTSRPGGIVAPSHVCGPGTASVLFTRLVPNEMGTVAVDGVSAGTLTTNANGWGSLSVARPVTGDVHAITWTGATSGTIVPGTLLVNVDPATVTTNPADTAACDGTTASFTAAATGALGVKWQLSTDGGGTWADIGGATSDTYGFTATLADNGHYYRAVYAGMCGSIPTSPALLQVNTPPSITMQPTNASICATPNATFSVAATGFPLQYQWQVSTGLGYTNLAEAPPYSGTVSSTLTITNGTTSLSGNLYRCIVSGPCFPSAVSNGAILVVDSVHPNVSAPAAATATQSTCAP